MEWTSGYRADIDYTYGYYRELAPGLIDFALLYAGFDPPRRGDDVRYLELGYGQGVSLNVHAAACPGEYWGADFNPVHAAHSQQLAQVSGANAHFTDESFAEMLGRDDMPSMDYVALHGIWSWISDENRKVIVETFRKRLRVGGAAYNSYNTFPGWATAMPLRHILSIHSEAAGSDIQGMVTRIDAALAFGQQLADVNARYFQNNPLAKTRLDSFAGQNRNYLAHEFFNEFWTPMYFSELQAWLGEAKLSYACPASLIDQLDALNLTTPQREMLNSVPPGILRETVRDYLQNQQFRKDLYTRGARHLSPLERLERLRDVRVVLTGDQGAPEHVETVLGKVSLRKDIYEPVTEAIAEGDGGPKSIAELGDSPKLAKLPPGGLLESLAVLVGMGRVHPAQSDAAIAKAAPRCAKLNAHFIERARITGEIGILASPVIGGAVGAGRFEMMFAGARAAGHKRPADWAKTAWNTLAQQNQQIIKNGEVLKTAEANLEELTAQAKTFADGRLKLLQRLKVVD